MLDVITTDTEPRAPTQRALGQAPRRRAWTVAENAVLCAHYPTEGPAFCAGILNRPVTQIYPRARRLGLFAPGNRERATRKPWHSDDAIDAAIRRAWLKPARGMAAALGAQLGRPKWWICKRAVALGLSHLRLKEPPWTEREDALLQELAHLTPVVIARRLRQAGFRRTVTAVVIRLKRHGVSRKQARLDAGVYSATAVAKLLGVDAKTISAWIAREGLPAKARGTARTEQQGGDEWDIHQRPLRRWIATHAQLIDLRKVERFWFFDLAFGHVA